MSNSTHGEAKVDDNPSTFSYKDSLFLNGNILGYGGKEDGKWFEKEILELKSSRDVVAEPTPMRDDGTTKVDLAKTPLSNEEPIPDVEKHIPKLNSEIDGHDSLIDGRDLPVGMENETASANHKK
ncbi:PDZ domain-containing protein [Sesbania bispinosa]|nr:PDZ domain-containing protein [Sesbania bispinosa]